MPIAQRQIIDFFTYYALGSDGVGRKYTCNWFREDDDWIKFSQQGVSSVFEFSLNPGVSIMCFYERDNGVQFFHQYNSTNTAMPLVFYTSGVLWFRVLAGRFRYVVFYTYDGSYGVEWNLLNPPIEWGTDQVTNWDIADESVVPFEVLRHPFWSYSGTYAVVNMEFYYHFYQFNIIGLNFK